MPGGRGGAGRSPGQPSQASSPRRPRSRSQPPIPSNGAWTPSASSCRSSRPMRRAAGGRAQDRLRGACAVVFTAIASAAQPRSRNLRSLAGRRGVPRRVNGSARWSRNAENRNAREPHQDPHRDRRDRRRRRRRARHGQRARRRAGAPASACAAACSCAPTSRSHLLRSANDAPCARRARVARTESAFCRHDERAAARSLPGRTPRTRAD